MINKIFGRWTVKEFIERKGNHKYYLCECACGSLKKVQANNLKSGKSISCGCVRREMIIARNHKHGHAIRNNAHPLYSTWRGMIDRCHRVNAENYARYGGRGIAVCSRWRSSFPNFLDDMKNKPAPEYSIDRIDVDGAYEPNNCRWDTPVEKAANKRQKHD